jgi:dienelactone hydrolase
METSLALRRIARFIVGIAFLSAGVARGQERVDVPSTELRDGKPLELPGLWFFSRLATGHKAPALVLLHGCGGPYDSRGELGNRMRSYVALLREQGWHLLVIDSFTPRGERELCTKPLQGRSITQANRRLDVLGALQWLAQRPEVDGARIAVVGWSHGGSAALAATDMNQTEVRDGPVKPRAAVAFYPGCGFAERAGYRPSAPLLLLLGESDNWTPPLPCKALANEQQRITVRSFAGAFHGFDSSAELRVRHDVPNGVNPGQGVTVGGNPEARDASRRELLAFLREQLK